MARTGTRPTDADEEYLEPEVDETDDTEESSADAAPAVSDSRRRRQMKRGDLAAAVSATATSTKGRPTPSHREEEAPKKSRNFVVRFFQNMREYFAEVRSELTKVAWPTRDEANRITRIVFVITSISAVFLGIFSFVFGALVTAIADPSSSTWSALFASALVVIVAGVWLFQDRLFGNRTE